MKNLILTILIALTTLSFTSCVKEEEDDNPCNCGKITKIDNSGTVVDSDYQSNGKPYNIRVHFVAWEKNNCTKVVTEVLVSPIGYEDPMTWEEYEHFINEWNARKIISPKIGDDYCRY